MEEKMIEKKQVQKIVTKKVYTPPMLTIYGKLTELTAGGTLNTKEPGGGPGSNDPQRRA